METAVNHLSKQEAEELWYDIATILKTNKPPKPNLKQEKVQAFKELKENTDIKISSADKTNATVVMDNEEYTKKTERHTYRQRIQTNLQTTTVWKHSKAY